MPAPAYKSMRWIRQDWRYIKLLSQNKLFSDKPEIIDAIQSSGKLDEDNEKILSQVILEHKKGSN